jgi:secretion/DNA translocation related CpaE-like protein
MADSGRIAVVTAREDLRTAVLRLAALVGAGADAATDSAGVRGLWRLARIVVVGSDLAEAVAAAGLQRRADVVVVAVGEPDAGLWRAAVELGATSVVTLPAGERELIELLGAALEETTVGSATIAVVGGCGGAGASTLASALAVSCARTARTALVDGDCFGGGIDLVLGAERQAGARWPDLAQTRGRLGSTELDQALPHLDRLAVLSWDRAGATVVEPAAVGAVMAAATRAFTSVVIDLPRRVDAISTILVGAADRIVMVVPATVRATAAAATVAPQLRRLCGELQVVVRDAGSGRLSVAEVGTALGLPTVASFHSESSVAAAADRGDPPLKRPRGSLHEACQQLLAGSPGTRVAA